MSTDNAMFIAMSADDDSTSSQVLNKSTRRRRMYGSGDRLLLLEAVK